MRNFKEIVIRVIEKNFTRKERFVYFQWESRNGGLNLEKRKASNAKWFNWEGDKRGGK